LPEIYIIMVFGTKNISGCAVGRKIAGLWP